MVKIWSVTYCRDFEFDYELGTLIITTILLIQLFVHWPLKFVLETGLVASNCTIGQLLGTNFVLVYCATSYYRLNKKKQNNTCFVCYKSHGSVSLQ